MLDLGALFHAYIPDRRRQQQQQQKKEKKITNWTNLLVLGSSGCKSLWPFVIHPDLSQCIITSKGNFICLCLLVVWQEKKPILRTEKTLRSLSWKTKLLIYCNCSGINKRLTEICWKVLLRSCCSKINMTFLGRGELVVSAWSTLFQLTNSNCWVIL